MRFFLFYLTSGFERERPFYNFHFLTFGFGFGFAVIKVGFVYLN